MSATIFCKTLTVLAAAALGFAGYSSVRLAWADVLFRANTLGSVKAATTIDPGNASYHAWLAEIEEHDGLDPEPELEIASKLNPSASAIWVRRGLRAESQGDLAGAEQSLLKAASIDKLYAPRWALANYYARRGDPERFWPWARQAFEMGYGDLSALFRLCWGVADDGAAIFARAIPPRRDVAGKYLAFLTQENRLDAAEPVARSFLAQAGPADAPILLAYCDRLLEQKLASAAMALWNALGQRGLIPLSSLDPARGVALTNGGFQTEPLQRGFDWRIPAGPEVSVARSGSPPALRFRLSGKQAEHCELLSQLIPLTPGKQYVFRFEYKGPPARSGVSWRIGELAQSDDLAGEEWTEQHVTFTAGDSSLEPLTLVYDRAPGAVRTEGDIWLRNTSIVLAR
jgi:hypothetical protein